MGLKVHSLSVVPEDPSRAYYVYLLDFGWQEPLGRALHDNFDRMAELASNNNAAVILGLGNEFNDEVLAYHGVNGAQRDLLPAILITNKPPQHFQRPGGSWSQERDRLVLVPLREHCSTPTDVAGVISKIFDDIVAGNDLSNFSVVAEQRAGLGGAFLDALVLRPSVGGVGIDLKKFFLRGGGVARAVHNKPLETDGASRRRSAARR